MSMPYSLNFRGKLYSIDEPQVMGIVNVTPDSFYPQSRVGDERNLIERVGSMLAAGARFIDIGACSTRPGSVAVGEAEETSRLRSALTCVRREYPEALLSVDTYRPEVAKMVVEEYGVDIINDVGPSDEALADPSVVPEMFHVVARLSTPYIYTSRARDVESVLLDFACRTQQLRELGQKDIILDPGFGFGKTVDDNYRLMSELDKLLVMELPLLVGISRKSMIYKPLGLTPADALPGTTALNTIALMKGASILRVHDVAEAVQTVAVVQKTLL